jgi:hypothetical protein
MARELGGDGRRRDELATMRAADSDRQQVADRLKTALDEGRLTLHEYDERVTNAYAARTYAELLALVADLPRPGLSATEVTARQAAAARRASRRLPVALMVLWTVWGAAAAVNLVVWILVAVAAGGDVYPWPIWMLPAAAALLAVTVGVQAIRRQGPGDER